MPVYKRKNGNWIIRFYRGDGTRCQQTVKAKDYPRKRDVQALEQRLKAEDAAEAAGQHTFSNMMEKYWTEHAEGLAWARTIGQHLETMTDEFGDHSRIADLTTSRISEAVTKWRTTPVYNRSRQQVVMDRRSNKPKLPTNATINRRLAVLRGAMRKAQRLWQWEDVPSVSWEALMRPEAETVERNLSTSEQRLLINACPPWLADIVEFALATGLRRAPILSLQWQDVDLEKQKIVPIGKGKKSNPVELTEWAIEILARIGPKDLGPVFTRDGAQIRSIKGIWERSRCDAGLPDVRFHDLRHTFAQSLMDATGDVALVQDALHHSSLSTTRRYAHRRRSHVREAAEAAQKWRKR